MPKLVEGCDIILGNEEDAEKHFGLHPEGVRDAWRISRCRLVSFCTPATDEDVS